MHGNDQLTELRENSNFSCLTLCILWDMMLHLALHVQTHAPQVCPKESCNTDSISSQNAFSFD